jgi:hypothetical protein
MSRSVAEFKDRAKAVRAFLQSLKALETGYFTKQSYRRAAALAASRASTFIMIYNCVEHSLRESMLDLREDMQTRVSRYAELRRHWQLEIFRVHFQERLNQGGTRHHDLLEEVFDFLPGKVDWRQAQGNLPFAGNIDETQLYRLASAMGYRWRAPKGTFGGTDLNIVRKARNDLAHGLESFEAVGGRYTATDLADKFGRIQKVMISYLRMVERYKVRQLYLRSVP